VLLAGGKLITVSLGSGGSEETRILDVLEFEELCKDEHAGCGGGIVDELCGGGAPG
jgi:hypothetical protein